jgi:hypothetical protein
MLRKFVLFAILIVLGVNASAATYYVSSGIGTDTNTSAQAQSKTTPWAHAPGMGGCASNCASYTPVAGDQFIFRGGDTWTIAAQWNWTWSGSSGSHIYIGVDQTWYTGGSWARPILTGGGTFPGASTANFLQIASGSPSYVTVDNLEWTGFNWTVSVFEGFIGIGGSSNGLLFENNYFHGWTHGSAAENNGEAVVICEGAGTLNNTFYRNVVDGSDTAENSFMGIQGSCVGDVSQNEFSQLMYGFNGDCKFIRDNVFNSVGFPSYDGASHNGVMLSNVDSSSSCLFYNNVVRGNAITIALSVQITPVLGTTSYAFNNVQPDMSAGNGAGLECGEFFSSDQSGGTCTWFNNTLECGPDSNPATYCYRIGTGLSGTVPAAIYEYNNHIIGNGTITAVSPECASACPVTTVTQITQSKATANGQGYTLAQTYSFSPTVGGSTIAAGTNESSICTAIGAIDATAGTACLSDTTYGVSYNATTHTVSWPARTPVARGSTWDVGAYQYSSGGGGSSPGAPSAGMLLSAQIREP